MPGTCGNPPRCPQVAAAASRPVRRHSASGSPRRRAARKPAMNVSPAPSESTTATARASIRAVLSTVAATLPAAPQVTTAVRAPAASSAAATASPSRSESQAEAKATVRPAGLRLATGEVTDRSCETSVPAAASARLTAPSSSSQPICTWRVSASRDISSVVGR